MKRLNLKGLLFGMPRQQAQYTGSTQEWIPVEDIQQGIILTKDGRYLKVLELLPVNFELKSPMEQKNIIYYFASYLKIAPDTLQILSVTQPADGDGYEAMLRERQKEEPSEGCRELIEDNIREVRYLTTSESVSRRFFLAFQLEPRMRLREDSLAGIAERLEDEEQTARRYLSMCGLEVITPDYRDNHQMEILYGLLNPRTSRRAKLPLHIFDGISTVYGAGEEFTERLDEEYGFYQEETAAPEAGAGTDSAHPQAPEGAEPQKKEMKKRKKREKREKPPELNPLESGGYTVADVLAPSSADFTHRDYIRVDGVCQATLYVTGYGYPTAVGGGWLNLLVEAGEGVSVSFTCSRQSREKILPRIAKTTMLNRSRMRGIGDTRQDYEEVDGAIGAGLFLKEEMNRNGEDFYYMTTLLQVSAPTPEELERRIEDLEGYCAAREFQVRRADYCHKEGFLASLPFLHPAPELERKGRRNILTRDLAASFPFSSYELCDRNGIFLGLNLRNRSVCQLDLFDSNKYESGNMMIFGRTGSGKTHLEQCIALRFRELGVPVLIIVPEKGYEYRPACEAVGGQYIKLAPGSSDCVNWMEIRRASRDANAAIKGLEEREDSLLAQKIEELLLRFSLRMPALSNEDRELLDSSLVECYRRYGITMDNRSLWGEDGQPVPQPDFHALYRLFMETPETKKFATAISRFVTGSAASMGGQTNVDLSNRYIVLDISEAGKDLMVEMMYQCVCLGMELCYQDISQPKVILLDELWRLIGAGSNPQVAERVLEIYKIIRGLGGAVIGGTQDLTDGEGLEDGKYARGILNACRFKIILPLEEQEAMRVQEALHLSEEEALQILRNRRGEGLLCAGNIRIPVAFHATQKEHEMITTSRSDLARQKAGRTE